MIKIKELGGRKFLFAVLLITLAFFLILFKRLDSQEFMQIALATLAVFTVTNSLLKNKNLIS